MSMSLVSAMQNNTNTTNGMAAFKSTGSNLVDLFSKIGDSRDVDLSSVFKSALSENQEVALRTLLWARDIRGGAGERNTFRKLCGLVANSSFEGTDGFIRLIPEVGRWDDLFIFFDTKYEKEALFVIEAGLAAQDGLCAKWMPRQGETAVKIRKHLDLSPKQYRKYVVAMTNVVEQKMCAKEWGAIEYSHVPSKAIGQYAKAFSRNDGTRFTAFKQAAEKGEVKVNASAVFPHDVVALLNRDAALAEAQWKNLPDYLEGSEERILAVVDVSGSMLDKIDSKSTVSCMDVSVAMGIYVSQRLTGPFKDAFITFTSKPKLIVDSGSLAHRVMSAKMCVGYDTNLEGVFDTVLTTATRNSLSQDQMPTKILIMSDMQFNAQIRDYNATSIEMIRNKYKKAGYEMPQIVYWNIGAGKYDNVPVTSNEFGTTVVSGYSPAILKSILGKSVTPLEMVLDTVGVDRYNYLQA